MNFLLTLFILIVVSRLFTEQKKQKLSEVKTGLDEAESLVIYECYHWCLICSIYFFPAILFQ